MERITRTFSKSTRWGTTTSDAYSDDGGRVWRWVSSDNLVPMDVASEYLIPVDPVHHRAALDADMAELAARYRAAQATRTMERIAEERAMARAAHGPGVTLVNVITGERYTT